MVVPLLLLNLPNDTSACYFHNTEPFKMYFMPKELEFSDVYFDIKHYPIYSIFLSMIFFKLDKLTFLLYQNKRQKIKILLV